MIALLLNKKKPGKIGIIELDATVRESHEYTNTLTEFPVEKGFNINDHVIRQPEKLTIEGFITNTPIPRSSDLKSLQGANTEQLVYDNITQSQKKQPAPTENRVESALEKLLDLAGFPPATKNTDDITTASLFPKVIDIVETGLRQYKNMVITRITIPRDKDTGETLRFTCEMKHVITVLTETVTMQNVSELNGRAPNSKKQGTNESKKGNQDGKKVTQVKSTSFLKQLVNLGIKIAG